MLNVITVATLGFLLGILMSGIHTMTCTLFDNDTNDTATDHGR